jgi:NEMP family
MFFITELNFNRLVIFFAGLILFFISPTVCEKAIFHYTTGTLIGVLGSILIIVYLISRLFPKVYEKISKQYSISINLYYIFAFRKEVLLL